MVARRRDRLEALAAELTRQHGTANQVVALDLLAEGAVDELWRQVGDLDVGIVVANAGISVAGPLVDNSPIEELNVLTLDGVVPLQLAHRFGPDIQFELVIHTGDNPCGELQRCNSASG